MYAPNSKRQKIFLAIFVLTALTAAVAALRPAPPGSVLGMGGHDKLAHGLVFMMLAALLGAARGGLDLRAAGLLALGGLGVETLQLLQPTRQFSLLDLAANCTGIVLYCAARRWVFKSKAT